MESDSQQSEAKAFSYDILDEEARKISELVLLVQSKYATCAIEELPLVIFEMGDDFHNVGRLAEAEFLYLHAVSLWERQFKPQYPYEFRGLREYAQSLAVRHNQVMDVELDQAA